MQTVNIHQTKTQFSKLVNAVLNGEEIVIAKAGKPAVKLVPFTRAEPVKFGVLKKKIRIAKDFDAPLPDDILIDFEG